MNTDIPERFQVQNVLEAITYVINKINGKGIRKAKEQTGQYQHCF